MTVTSCALIILLSAFNGIEKMIEGLYSEFDQEIIVNPAIGKTTSRKEFDQILKYCNNTPEINATSFYMEERILLRKKKKWVNAQMIGVESSFYAMSEMDKSEHLINGKRFPSKMNYGLIGIGLAQKLGLKSMESNLENVILYAPKQNLKIRFGKNPFYQENVSISGVINYNKETNDEVFVMDLNFAQDFMNKEDLVTGMFISTSVSNREKIKEELNQKFKRDFQIKSNIEKNEIIFKTSKSEKLIVTCILIFVFILSLFNLVASLTMLHLEKRNSIHVLVSMGFRKIDIMALYLYEGVLITVFGIVAGIFLGSILVLLHEKLGLIYIPGSQKPFPVFYSLPQVGLISFLLICLSFLVTFVTSRFIVNSLKKL